MLADFPFPYENESIYSLIARYQNRSGNRSMKKDYRELFGETRTCIATDLPSGLSILSRRIIHYGKELPEQLINNHTPFNYYTNFIPFEKRELIKSCMLRFESVNKIHLITGQVASTVKEQDYFQFCEECLREDIKNFGETYWRVNHQLPGVLYCIKHKKRLRNTSILFRQRNSKLIAATFENCISLRKDAVLVEKFNTDEEKLLLKIAEESININSYFFDINIEVLQKKYFQLLNQHGYTSPNGKINQKKLVYDFIEFYGVKLLTLLQSLPDKQGNYSWLNCIVRKHRKSFHPLRHILLCIFLNESISSMNTRSHSDSDLFQCRNPAAKHYSEQTAILKKKKKDKKGNLIGTVSCSCGFEYIIHIYKYQVDKNLGIGRVLKYGKVWEEKLIELIDVKKLSYRKTARVLNADVNTIIKKYHGLKDPLINASELKKDCENDIEKDRNDWVKAQQINPAASKTELRNMYPALYMRLYSSSRDWMNINSPNPVVRVIKPRIDWGQRDLVILEQIKEHYLFLKKTDQMNRITIKEFGLAIMNLSRLEKNLDKLPRTRLFLSEILHTEKN